MIKLFKPEKNWISSGKCNNTGLTRVERSLFYRMLFYRGCYISNGYGMNSIRGKSDSYHVQCKYFTELRKFQTFNPFDFIRLTFISQVNKPMWSNFFHLKHIKKKYVPISCCGNDSLLSSVFMQRVNSRRT